MLKSKTVSTFYEADINALVLRGLREFEGLDGLRFASGTAKAIIYPTDDVCLNEEQYNAIVSILKGGEDMTVIQCGWSNNFFAEDRIAYTFCEPFCYEEYSKLDFFSPSIIFSSLHEWIIIIDESLNGGEALIVGDPNRIAQFLKTNDNGIHDLLRFVSFYLNDAWERSYKTDYLKKMIHLLLPTDDQRDGNL